MAQPQDFIQAKGLHADVNGHEMLAEKRMQEPKAEEEKLLWAIRLQLAGIKPPGSVEKVPILKAATANAALVKLTAFRSSL